MKVLATLLCALIPATTQGQDLMLYLIPDTPAHVEAWQIIQSAARRAGVTIAVRHLPPERGMVMANRGEVDGAIGRTMLAVRDYPDLVPVAEPLMLYAPSAYSYKRIDVAAGWASLSGLTVCVRRGYSLTDQRTRHLPRHRFDNDASLLRMLRRGGCDVAIMDRNNQAGRAALAADPALYLLQPALEETPLYLFLHKRHAALAERLAEALRQVKRD